MINYDLVKEYGYKDVGFFVIYLDGTKVYLPPTGIDSLSNNESDRKFIQKIKDIQDRNMRILKLNKIWEK